MNHLKVFAANLGTGLLRLLYDKSLEKRKKKKNRSNLDPTLTG